MILGVGFGVKLSSEDILEIEGLRDVAMATNFVTKIAITGFVFTIATRRLVMEGVLVVGRHSAAIADTLQLRDFSTATTFWLSMGYNFTCMIASDTLFDSRWVFRDKLSNEDIAEIKGLRNVAMATNFETILAAN